MRTSELMVASTESEVEFLPRAIVNYMG